MNLNTLYMLIIIFIKLCTVYLFYRLKYYKIEKYIIK